MSIKSKTPVAAGACNNINQCSINDRNTITQIIKKPLPRLNPLIAIGLERFKNEIMAADFYSREYNVVLPSLISELLRMIREVKP